MLSAANERRPTWVEVDLKAIASNVAAIKTLLPPGTRLMAVVKANAYGHGAVPVAQASLAAGAEWLGVATPAEGWELRQAGIDAPILVLGAAWPFEAEWYLRGDLRATVTALDEAEALSEAAARVRGRVLVHVKVDTGMGRLGVPFDRAAEFVAAISRLPHLEVEGLFSHFATSDEAELSFAREQLARFNQALADLERLHIPISVRHLANSGAIFNLMPEAAFDMVRLGISLYGYYPSASVPRRVELRPALRWFARAVFVKRVAAGTAISYGSTYRTERETTIVTLPVGYADGLRRQLSNKGAMLMHGRRVRIAGRVCMDQVMLDVGDLPVAAGDKAVIIGEENGERITADDIASWLGTIPYEVLTCISPRVPRVYLRGSDST
ncbi:MAG: alanine racemase [Limnochordales bacterium]|nr:alanine racemase [Limnochordales bacterium]